MGLSSAGDEHNRRCDEALSGMSNFQKFVEDVLIFYNWDIKSHVNSVPEALQRCAVAGITLHKEKFVFAKQEVDYCGLQFRLLATDPMVVLKGINLVSKAKEPSRCTLILRIISII